MQILLYYHKRLTCRRRLVANFTRVSLGFLISIRRAAELFHLPPEAEGGEEVFESV